MDFMELRSDTTRLRKDAQYLKKTERNLVLKMVKKRWHFYTNSSHKNENENSEHIA